MRRWRAWPLSLGAVGLLACSSDAPPESGRAQFDDYFEEVRRVELEESSEFPMVGIASLSQRPGGGFAVADELGDRVFLFHSDGRLDRMLGGPGEGPGELDAPTYALEVPDGRVFVTQRANRRLTVYSRAGAPVALTVPGHYGTWLHDLGDRLVARIGSREDRYAVISHSGDSVTSFGALDPEVNQRPFWIYYARESATVLGDRIAINTSFYPSIRLFSTQGDSVGGIGRPPPTWIQAGDPPVQNARTEADQHLVREWSTGFTVVSTLAAVGNRLVVQYGRFAPTDRQLYQIAPSMIDVYDLDGGVLAESLPLETPIIAGGSELVVLVGEPPTPWTLVQYRWRDPVN